jgi:hypothetical protein
MTQALRRVHHDAYLIVWSDLTRLPCHSDDRRASGGKEWTWQREEASHRSSPRRRSGSTGSAGGRSRASPASSASRRSRCTAGSCRWRSTRPQRRADERGARGAAAPQTRERTAARGAGDPVPAQCLIWRIHRCRRVANARGPLRRTHVHGSTSSRSTTRSARELVRTRR